MIYVNACFDWRNFESNSYDHGVFDTNQTPTMYSELVETGGRWRHALLKWLRLGRAKRDHATTRVVLLSWVGALGHPLCYLVWHRLWPVEFESVPLRAVGVALCVVGLFARRFSRRWLDIYLLVTLSYVLSFFFTFMCLMNHAGAIWTESLLISLIVLFHFDMGMASLAYVIGTTAACCAVVLLGHGDLLLSRSVLQQLPVHGFAIAVLSATKISRNALEQEKLAGLGAGLATVSHELRTPLISIEANVRGLIRMLAASSAGQRVRLDALDALSRIQFEARHMNHMVDLFLLSATAVNRNLRPREMVSMAEAIGMMMKRYPFTSASQRDAVTVELRHDFRFAGQGELAVVILLNLLRNALKAIHRAGKGRVRIVVDGAHATPRLLFIDTACGVAPQHLPLIFRRFYSFPPHQGSGIGLALCRDIMAAWQARIRCVSRAPAYAVFILEFPRSQAPAIAPA